MGSSLFTILKEKFPSKETKIRRLEVLRDQLCGSAQERKEHNTDRDAAYRDGVWDALTQVIILTKEGEL